MAKDQQETIVAYKGFDMDLKCRGHQFEIGKLYTHHGKVEACSGGFHACEHPLDVFAYYAPANSRFAVVEQSGKTDRHGGDSKTASEHIHIKAEISIGQLVQAAIDFTFKRAKWLKKRTATGYRGAASATGYQGAASATGHRGAASATGHHGAASATGDWGAASATGDQGAASATGYQGAASATGHRGAASATGHHGAASATGDWGAASATGYQGAASATGYQGAASATGYRGAASATGDQGAASATGYRGAASATGDWGAASATGNGSVAIASGYEGRAKASEGCAIFLCERDSNDNITHVFAGIAGKKGIKPDTWYMLKNGKPVEVNA